MAEKDWKLIAPLALSRLHLVQGYLSGSLVLTTEIRRKLVVQLGEAIHDLESVE